MLIFIFALGKTRNRVNDLIIPAYMERYLTLRDANDSIMEYYLYIGAEVELRDFFIMVVISISTLYLLFIVFHSTSIVVTCICWNITNVMLLRPIS